MSQQFSALQEVRRTLGYAALGVMVGPERARSAHDAVVAAQQEVGDVEIQGLVRAVSALNRGFMPEPTVLRQGQREAHHLILALQDRGQQIDVPRAR